MKYRQGVNLIYHFIIIVIAVVILQKIIKTTCDKWENIFCRTLGTKEIGKRRTQELKLFF